LAVPELHRAFLEFAKLGEDHGAFIGAYVLMPDHIHLFVALDAETKRSADSYGQKWEYVRANPVRAGLAKSWEDWPFCGLA